MRVSGRFSGSTDVIGEAETRAIRSAWLPMATHQTVAEGGHRRPRAATSPGREKGKRKGCLRRREPEGWVSRERTLNDAATPVHVSPQVDAPSCSPTYTDPPRSRAAPHPPRGRFHAACVHALLRRASTKPAGVPGMIAVPVACSYARSRRANLAFSKTSRLVRPQGLRPLWYLKSIQCVRGLECLKVSQSIGR